MLTSLCAGPVNFLKVLLMKKLQLKKQVTMLQIIVEKCKRHPAYGAMSGFGTMASCAAAELCAILIVGDTPSSFATIFSRYSSACSLQLT